MLRRDRNNDREPVVVELVETGPDGLNMSPAPLTDPGSAWPGKGPSAAGDVFSHGGSVAVLEAERVGTTSAVDSEDTAKRSVPWPAVGLVVALLLGFVLWATSRGSETDSDLPRLPRNPVEQYSWTAQRAIDTDVSVVGSAREAYVTVANAESARVYALDQNGSERWSIDIQAETVGAVPRQLLIDEQLVVATAKWGFDDGVDDPAVTTRLTSIATADGSIGWQQTYPGVVVGRIENRIVIVNHTEVSTGGLSSSTPSSSTPSSSIGTSQRTPVELSTVDLDTGVATTERFDAVDVDYSLAPRASIAVERDGTVFLVSEDLTPVSTPIKVDDRATFGANQDRIVVIDATGTKVYAHDGTPIRSTASVAATDGAQSSQIVESIDGLWWYSGFAVDSDVLRPFCRPLWVSDDEIAAVIDVPNAVYAAAPCEYSGFTFAGEQFSFDPDSGDPAEVIIEPSGDDDTYTLEFTESTAPTDMTESTEPTYTLEFADGTVPTEMTVTTDAPDAGLSDTEESVSDGSAPGPTKPAGTTTWAEIASDVAPLDAMTAANGYVAESGNLLVGTLFNGDKTAFELPIPEAAQWDLIDGGVAIWGPDYSGSTNAVKITIFS